VDYSYSRKIGEGYFIMRYANKLGSTGINVINEIKLLRKLLLDINLLTMVLRAKKMALFDFDVTDCKTTQKWQKDGHFTTPVPVDP
jgi:hypothetical protein